ncbi:GNAT family N-acetyltransferase [Planctomonas sp. JC2975]|uniref:GNAT family N-acetyltransferase n=1 Tax=Planctomonas sp. JC2975 TaxID=2729626 RepID=UPI001472B5B0|nr:GNAT family N-acetyltransferase [Planctomonas sp. JC2975]NNC12212.1 GNAT family N-acetyltransferase [Planctomonas sp. JC2975]
MQIALRAATLDDLDWIAELRAVVLRDDLTRLGRYDEVRVRRRLRDAFHPELTTVILVDDEPVGSVTVRPEGDGIWIEHFYLDPAVQGLGVGTSVLASVLSAESGSAGAVPVDSVSTEAVSAGETDEGSAGAASAPETDARPHRLNVLQGSRARRLYERFGFAVDTEDDVDVFMSRPRATLHIGEVSHRD